MDCHILEDKLLGNLKYILDIGSSKLNLLAVSKLNKMQIIFAEEQVFYDGFMDGEFLSESLEEKFSELITNLKTKTHKQIKSIIVGVPAEFSICVCKRISRKFPEPHKLTNKDVFDMYESNLSFGDSEQYDVINYSPMRYVLDDNHNTLTPIGCKTSSVILDASYILAKKSFTNKITKMLNNLGIQKVDFVSGVLGQGLMVNKEKRNRPFAIVDVGHISTSVCVHKGEGLALLTSFSMGGGHISSDIMQVLNLSFKDAELIKRKVILTIESNKNDYYQACSKGNLIKAPINITNQIVKSRIENIANVVGDILSMDEVFKNIDIYLTGDGVAFFKGVKNIFKNATGHEVYELKNPFDNSQTKYQTSKTGLVRLLEVIK